MPKLKAVHFSRVGHPQARLDGISFYLTPKGNPKAEPCDTVPKLENGGGKTSLIDLIFSCVIPNKNEFAGKTRDDSDRTFDQYFATNELGMIVTEWSLGEDMPIRIIGQCVFKKNTIGTDEDRRFFSFLVTDDPSDYQVTDLPMRQFKSEKNLGNASSVEAFINNLRQLMAIRSHQQLEVTDNQRRWTAGLRSWGIEPDVFRLQIYLNKNEGGSGAMAKDNFGDNEKMIGLIARLCLSKDAQQNTKKSIEEHRHKLSLLPQKEKEVKLWTFLRDEFSDLVEPGNLLEKAKRDFSTADATLKTVAKKVIATPQELAKKIASIEEKRSAALLVLANEKDGLAQLQNSINWVARNSAVLELKGKEEDLEKAASHQKNLTYRLRSLKAQNHHLEVLRLRSEEDGIKEAITEASKPAQDVARRLNGVGVKLIRLYGSQRESVLLRQGEAEEMIQLKRNRLGEISNEISNVKQETGSTITALENLDEWFAVSDLKYKRLEENGAILAEDSDAACALIRSEDSTHDLNEKLAQAKDKIEGLEQQKSELVNERDGYKSNLEADNARIKDFDRKLFEHSLELEEISSNTVLCEFLEVDSLDPYRASLSWELDVKIGRLQHDIFKLEMDQRRDQTAQDVYRNGYPLAQPQEDVWAVVDALNAESVHAFTYVQYLCENNFSPEAIRDLLRKDPARYGGVCITHGKYLEKAEEVAGELPSLRGPVQITPVDLPETGIATVGVAVSLPADDATYNLESAKRWADQIQEAIDDREKKINVLEAVVERFTNARDKLRNFRTLWPEVKVERIKAGLVRAKENVETLLGKIQRLDGQVNEVNDVISGLVGEVDSISGEIKKFERYMESLRGFVEEYESKLWDKRSQRENLFARHEQLNARLGELQVEFTQVERERDGFAEEVFAARNAAKRLEEERGKVSFADASNCSEDDLPSENDLSKLRSLYDGVLKVFEEKTEGLSLLETQLKGTQKILAVQEKTFASESADVPESFVLEVREKYPQGVNTLVLDNASNDLTVATEQIGDAKGEVRNAEKLLKQHNYPEGEITPPADSEQIVTLEACTSWMEDASALRNARSAAIDEIESGIEACRGEISEIKGRLDLLKSTVSSAKKHLDVVENDPTIQGYTSVQDAINNWGMATSDLTTLRKALEKQKSVVSAKTDKIIEVVNSETYNDLAPVSRRRINEARGTLHVEAQKFFDDAVNNLSNTEYTLRETEQEKNKIVGYLFDDVREVKTRLHDLENISRLPENNTDWSRWSNESFFKVTFSGKKSDDDYIKARLEDFLGKLLEQQSLPSSGLAILQGAAKYALKDITQIRTMKPNKHMDTDRYSLEEAAGWSGGEGLTYSVVALMVFSRMVAHVNATKEQGGGILLVDNPFGSCNLIPFLKLQRIVARLLNLQLIYPTALQDLEAISIFPNIIAFKKDEVDSLGRKHVRPDEEFLRSLESSHLTVNSELVDYEPV